MPCGCHSLLGESQHVLHLEIFKALLDSMSCLTSLVIVRRVLTEHQTRVWVYLLCEVELIILLLVSLNLGVPVL